MFSLEKKVVVITGAGGLLGHQHSLAAASAGADLFLLDVDLNALEVVKNDIQEKFDSSVEIFRTDITSEIEILKARDNCLSKLGGISCLINNAAVNPKMDTSSRELSRIENFEISEWDLALDVGLKGAFLCSKVFGIAMLDNSDNGVILNIASDLGVIAPNQNLYYVEGKDESNQPVKPVTYSVVKHGLIGLTRYFATYWPTKIRCNALCPGGVENGHSDEFKKRISNLIPQQRMASKEDYKGAIIFMLSDASRYMNGSIVNIDGGRSAW